ncbi:hypothetical protein QE418_001573 [Microbacterium testaceum]|uniref:hypothetical protein n=1 Tax=Microbacterium TaxID=33882 RepID=UPI001AEADC3B|nr:MULTISPECIES: hypothetical protein [Microbacterium]MDQ1112125.1 hypothetical protein [Microbacterium testaceum]MDQ1176001.1 hypothetical protein [Microbacterium sp. SORGH_AS_0421]MDR6097341.1 hypothetical protein [Microbacterium sp. SORGH_AS_0454]
MVGMIRVDDGVSDYHVSRIRQASDDLPNDAAITVVHGNREEDAPEAYTKKLESVAEEIAARVQEVREFALRNADALAQAVVMLQDHDQISDSKAREMTALIDDIASSPPPTSSGSATSAPSTPPTSADSSSDARSGFGA